MNFRHINKGANTVAAARLLRQVAVDTHGAQDYKNSEPTVRRSTLGGGFSLVTPLSYPSVELPAAKPEA
ncbi:hypothetical protein P4V43_27340 [Brevibacillus fortis]|uniref:hypothetical protein n=1 Tax=Brevibacillus fortis TaxID=2126352 RepID=UPI002E23805C|nr:hypothetical protein [Brevibacillus fortis]